MPRLAGVCGQAPNFAGNGSTLAVRGAGASAGGGHAIWPRLQRAAAGRPRYLASTRGAGPASWAEHLCANLRGPRLPAAGTPPATALPAGYRHDLRLAGTAAFRTEDYGADVAHVFTLDYANRWQLGQQIHYDQSRANGTRSGLWLGRLGYQRRLRPGHAEDSLSQMRLTVLGGVATDRRNGRDDAGVAYGFDATAIYFASGPTAPPLAVLVLGTRAELGPRTMQRLVAEAVGDA